MHHCLMRSSSVVLQDVEGSSTSCSQDCTTEAWEHSANRCRRLLRELIDSNCRLLRNDKRVSLTQRTNVKESQHLVVLIHSMARNLASDNFSENRVCHVARLAQFSFSFHSLSPSLRPAAAV